MAVVKLRELPRAQELNSDALISCAAGGSARTITVGEIVAAAVKRSLEAQAFAAPVAVAPAPLSAGAMLGAAGVVAAKNPTISRRFWAWLD